MTLPIHRSTMLQMLEIPRAALVLIGFHESGRGLLFVAHYLATFEVLLLFPGQGVVFY